MDLSSLLTLHKVYINRHLTITVEVFVMKKIKLSKRNKKLWEFMEWDFWNDNWKRDLIYGGEVYEEANRETYKEILSEPIMEDKVNIY
jgi:hypothetical protein